MSDQGKVTASDRRSPALDDLMSRTPLTPNTQPVITAAPRRRPGRPTTEAETFQNFARKSNPLRSLKIVTPPVSTSSMICNHECRRKYFWRYRMGLVPRGVTGIAAQQGSWLHSAMAGMLLGDSYDTVRTAASQELSALLKAAANPGVILPKDYTTKLERAYSRSMAMAWAFREILKMRNVALIDRSRTKILGVEQEIQATIRAAERRQPQNDTSTSPVRST
jgi:hypothetical protein